MKKSLIALAALGAFAGAASAQSSVTIYGIIDVGVSKLNGGTSVLNGGPAGTIGIRDGYSVKPSTSNRLGFRGTEDLGGGLKANFVIEHRFRPDDGTLESSTTFWQGQSWVGLSGNFGEVRLGRQYVPAFYIGLASDPWGYDYNVAGANLFTRGATGGTDVTRSPNAVGYRTPNLSGFTAEVQVAAGEGSAAEISNRRNVGANVMYSGGPLSAGVGYNDTDTVATQRYWNSFVAYDLGFVRPVVAYSRTTVGTVDTTSYLVGATAPLGGGRLKAVAARKNPDGGNNNTTKFGLGYEYFLSKRTSVHADVGTAKTQNLTRTTGVEAGVKHVF
ncbi:porin [Aquabacterium sp. J223]|uniref:porin n=1 Tax=Aquabacterium sp. J223 TaxID=2898431 RepID=UPI0021AD88A6|nr:porin [Aquabacterium sp. J223]UUX96527.1 porin [Aquabacterium sp. J223]